MAEPENLPTVLAAEIKRVQAKRERWLEYQRRTGHHAVFEPGARIMGACVHQAIDALASGDIQPMIAAVTALQRFDDND